MKNKVFNIYLIAIFMEGCSVTPSTNVVNHIYDTTTFKYCIRGELNCLENDSDHYLNQYNSVAKDCDQQAFIRNRIISEQMWLTDEEFRKYEKNLGNDVDFKNFAVHTVSIGLSAAATAVGGAATKTIIAAIDTGIKGTNTNFDNDVLHNKALNIIKNQMYKDRAAKSIFIKAKMKNSCTTYTLEEAKADLSEYRYAGQFDRALTNLENQTGGDAKALEAKDAKLTSGSDQAVTAAEQISSN